MPVTIDFLDTYYMAGMVTEIVPQQTFFRDRYFPTGAEDIFKSHKVLTEFQEGDRKMAPFVARAAGDILIGRKGYSVREYEPPYIAPSRKMTVDDLKKRGFGEAMYANSTPADRARALQMRDLSDLDRRIQRREEWMCAQVLINNACTMVEYIDDSTKGETITLQFYDTASDHDYTVQNTWDAANGDFFGDVEAMCAMLADRGLEAADLVMGSTAAQVVMNLEKVLKLLDNRNIQIGALRPQVKYPGVAWLGRLVFNGFELDLWSVRETYVDDSNVTQLYFPAKSAMVTAPNCGRLMYGMVTQMEPDKTYHDFALKRVPKLIVDEEKDTRKLRLACHPLAAPRAYCPFIYAADAVG